MSRAHDLLDHHDSHATLRALQDAESSATLATNSLAAAQDATPRNSALYWQLKGIHGRLTAVRDELRGVLRGQP